MPLDFYTESLSVRGSPNYSKGVYLFFVLSDLLFFKEFVDPSFLIFLRLILLSEVLYFCTITGSYLLLEPAPNLI